ncbi:hypothetical protein [Dickeya oryzae]|uniref:hypothetical protein n=1 Tax=Dickeya oryzae TaxID=1240404 RepID=UPI00039EF5FF|nr:hypothetical protein [Dickeya oryzae]
MIELNGTQLQKMSGATKRYAFDKNITDGMPVGLGQARCHTISYDTIANAIIDTINDIKQPAAGKMLDGLLLAIFPLVDLQNSIYTGNWSHNLQLATAAYNNYIAAQGAITAIKGLLSSWSVDLYQVKQHANELLKALNNSPDNLRVGNQTTNASIGSSVDIDSSMVTQKILSNVMMHWVEGGVWKELFYNSLKCNYIEGTAGYQLGVLLAETYSRNGVSLYSNGAILQTSSNVGQTTGVMGASKPLYPVVVPSPYAGSQGHCIFFQKP